MEFRDVERDFIDRSRQIVEQYQYYVMGCVHKDKQFDVTLLLNSLLGLVILPFESKRRAQKGGGSYLCYPEICKDGKCSIQCLCKDWGLSKLDIIKFKVNGRDEQDITLNKIIAMIRHSMAHAKFRDGNQSDKSKGLSVKYGPNKNGEKLNSAITEVCFVNMYKNNRNEVEFEANIQVEDLRVFAIKLANTVLSEWNS